MADYTGGAWNLRYPLSYRDLEEMFRERRIEIDEQALELLQPMSM